ncbi:hypothetical protein KFL_006830030 [Klebsormidium nitens]|uniref:Uncharacterized protein n=1 Tax=Klebsormidium nitens TaxID=105231 RepID=A0A1Y1IIZ7_KLENI|nr:hypothetical protein KFL_006830030 [Klebsormidium nitens]|eukprot:GAQ90774.1 hypothetical protein KFL_006830030 [Klebsormidium nitens]
MASGRGIRDWLPLIRRRSRSALQKRKRGSSDAPVHTSALALALLLLMSGIQSPQVVLGQTCGVFSCSGPGLTCCEGVFCFNSANGGFCCGRTACVSGSICCSDPATGDHHCCRGDYQCCAGGCCTNYETTGDVCHVDANGFGTCRTVCSTFPVVTTFCSLGPESNPAQNCCGPHQKCCKGSGHCCDSDCADRNGILICPDSVYGDPHISLSSLIDLEKHPDVEDFSFDFHGEANKTYCMISDHLFAVTVRMFGLSADVEILERPVEDPTRFFEGTWIDGIGFMYINWSGEERRVEVLLNHDSDSFGDAEPFSASLDGFRIPISIHDGPEFLWTSPDGMVKISPHCTRGSALSISVGESLDMDIFREFEDEIITEPPVQFLNFEIRHAATTDFVHGFLGQMYAPGAVEERLAMGTLEGFLHREYVEGADEDYETSSLTSSDCAFDRFGKDLSKASGFSAVNFGRRLLTPSVSDRLPVNCKVLDKGRKFTCA